MTNEDPHEPSRSDGRFVTTHWSEVLEARAEESGRAREAVAKLCRTYWRPVYAFVRRAGHGPVDAEDLTQGFFEQLLKRNTFAKADPERGRFRSFLLSCLKNHLASAHRRDHSLRRSPGTELCPLAAEVEPQILQDPSRDLDPESAFARQWALALLAEVMAGLQAEAEGEGWGELFMRLRPFVSQQGDTVTYHDLAASTGLEEGALRTRVSRLRKRYRERLRQTIGQTVTTPEEIDDEIRYLMSVLG